MNNIAKVLIGVGVVGVVATATYVVTKSSEKKTVVIRDFDEEGNPKTEIVEDESLLDRFKEAATKKVIKILAWVTLHQQQVEAVDTIIGLGAGLFNIVTAIRDYRAGNKMQSQINELMEFKDEFHDAWNDYQDATNHNVQWFENKLNDIHLDMSMLHEVHEALIEPPKKSKKTA